MFLSLRRAGLRLFRKTAVFSTVESTPRGGSPPCLNPRRAFPLTAGFCGTDCRTFFGNRSLPEVPSFSRSLSGSGAGLCRRRELFTRRGISGPEEFFCPEGTLPRGSLSFSRRPFPEVFFPRRGTPARRRTFLFPEGSASEGKAGCHMKVLGKEGVRGRENLSSERVPSPALFFLFLHFLLLLRYS